MWPSVPLLVLCLPMLSASCVRDGSPALTADAFRCVMPACVETITTKGLRPVNCPPDRCEGEELRKFDANMADALTCLERVRIQMAPCVGVKP